MPHNSRKTELYKTWVSQIGEDALKTWQNAPIEFTDEGHTLKILGREVMQTWETPVMKEIARV